MPLTCGALLRNRTVDLLLTIDRSSFLSPQVRAPYQQEHEPARAQNKPGTCSRECRLPLNLPLTLILPGPAGRPAGAAALPATPMPSARSGQATFTVQSP